MNFYCVVHNTNMLSSTRGWYHDQDVRDDQPTLSTIPAKDCNRTCSGNYTCKVTKYGKLLKGNVINVKYLCK